MRPVAADALLIEGNKVLLIRRGNGPFLGKWAIPGGFLEEDETLEECCVREAKEETGLEVRVVKLLGVYSAPSRDPRKTVGAVFLCKRVSGGIKGGDDAAAALCGSRRRRHTSHEVTGVKWFPLDKLPEMAFDHREILKSIERHL